MNILLIRQGNKVILSKKIYCVFIYEIYYCSHGAMLFSEAL